MTEEQYIAVATTIAFQQHIAIVAALVFVLGVSVGLLFRHVRDLYVGLKGRTDGKCPK